MELVVFLVSLFGFLALGIPIAIVLVLCSMVLMYYGGMWDSMFVMIIPQSMLDGANNYPLMAIPFFVFAGEIMTEGGLSKRVVKLAQLIIGRVRGGLGAVPVLHDVWRVSYGARGASRRFGRVLAAFRVLGGGCVRRGQRGLAVGRFTVRHVGVYGRGALRGVRAG